MNRLSLASARLPKDSAAYLSARLTLIGFSGFAGLIVLLHLLRADYNPVTRHLSEYAVGTSGWLMTLAFLLAGTACFALANTLHLSLTPSLILLLGCFLLGVAGIAEFVLALFPTDLYLPDGSQKISTSLSGSIHDTAANINALNTVAVALVIPFALRQEGRWRAQVGLASALAFLIAGAAGLVTGVVAIAVLPLAVRGIVRWPAVLITFVLLGLGVMLVHTLIGQIPGETVGLAQRFWVASAVVWGVVMASRLQHQAKLV